MNYHYKILGEQPVDIVVELGLGSCLSEWIPMANLLADQHGVLLYERAGINKSEESANTRTPVHIAEELYEFLKEISHSEKILLLAHSQGGLYAQQFCRRYPEMVKGLILLDPLSPHDYLFRERLSKQEYKKSGVDKSASFKMMYGLARLNACGIIKRLLKNAPPLCYYKEYTQEEVEDILESATKPMHAKTALAEYEEAHIKQNLRGLIKAETFPDLPIVLITHSSALAVEENMEFGHNTREFAAKIEAMWQKIMKQYLAYSTKSVWMEAANSTHYIHLQDPVLVLNAVKQIENWKECDH